MTDRLRIIASYFQLSPGAFADQVGISRPVISHIFSGRNKPSLEVVQKVATAFPELSLEWILMGKGEMLKSVAEKAVGPEIPVPAKVEAISDYTAKQENELPQDNTKTNPGISRKSELEASSRKINRIVLFYSDHSFEEFQPA